jgi:class 3 adenylate cyclase
MALLSTASRTADASGDEGVSEPRIQYAKTIDGVSIAYATLGEGKTFLLMPFPPMSWLAGWSTVAPLWTPLAESHRLVMYDPRGCGFSDRDAVDFSMEAMLRDLDVVAAPLGSEPFALIAVINAVPVGLTFAASHPAKVSHLIVCDGWRDFSDWAGSPVQAVEASLRGKDWTLFTETHARILWGVDDPALAHLITQWMQASCSPEAYQACYAALEAYRASPALARITAPTLVIHNRRNRWVPTEVGQRIAAGISGARLLLIDDLVYVTLASTIRDFVDDTSGLAPEPHRPSVCHRRVPDRILATVMFTDIVRATARAVELGDRRWRELLSGHHAVVREQLARFDGREIDTAGDGFLAAFDGPARALRCACAVVREVRGLGLEVRAGVHTGECEIMGDKLSGIAVHVGARVASLAGPGEVLVSSTVKDLVSGSGITFLDRGVQALKGIPGEWHLYAVVCP